MNERFSTGLEWLDEMLGGGLVPGTLTVALGATGIGKTQLGLAFAEAGRRQEGTPGILFDLTTRGDAQSHREYARRLFGWELSERDTIGDLDPDEWREWKVELSRKLDRAIAFFYANFALGVRRCVIDGVEPVEKARDSFQAHVIHYVYHQILHKDHD